MSVVTDPDEHIRDRSPFFSGELKRRYDRDQNEVMREPNKLRRESPGHVNG